MPDTATSFLAIGFAVLFCFATAALAMEPADWAADRLRGRG